jgi:signal peptidase I
MVTTAPRWRQAAPLGVLCALAVGATLAVISSASAHRARGAAIYTYRVPSQAMAPTLRAGEIVYVIHGGALAVGDVVVFSAPSSADAEACGVVPPRGAMCPRSTGQRTTTFWIKRIVAGPGETIAMRDGHVFVNGRRQSEPYAHLEGCSRSCTYTRAIRVPRGQYFLLGDNRAESNDSRFWGPVPLAWLEGPVEICGRERTHCRVLR